jgi:hypothetical protein
MIVEETVRVRAGKIAAIANVDIELAALSSTK